MGEYSSYILNHLAQAISIGKYAELNSSPKQMHTEHQQTVRNSEID